MKSGAILVFGTGGDGAGAEALPKREVHLVQVGHRDRIRVARESHTVHPFGFREPADGIISESHIQGIAAVEWDERTRAIESVDGRFVIAQTLFALPFVVAKRAQSTPKIEINVRIVLLISERSVGQSDSGG